MPPKIASIVEKVRSTFQTDREKIERKAAESEREIAVLNRYEVLYSRMEQLKVDHGVMRERLADFGSEAMSNFVRQIDNDFSRITELASRMVARDWVAGNSEVILAEHKKLTVDAAEKELSDFTAANSALLKKHGVI